jgi:hypothetical protein
VTSSGRRSPTPAQCPCVRGAASLVVWQELLHVPPLLRRWFGPTHLGCAPPPCTGARARTNSRSRSVSMRDGFAEAVGAAVNARVTLTARTITRTRSPQPDAAAHATHLRAPLPHLRARARVWREHKGSRRRYRPFALPRGGCTRDNQASVALANPVRRLIFRLAIALTRCSAPMPLPTLTHFGGNVLPQACAGAQAALLALRPFAGRRREQNPSR